MAHRGPCARGAPRAAWLALLFASLAALCSCDTISSDFNDFTQSITPPTPAQAAEWALDPYDAENRRRGTTLLSNAPWGGSEIYLKMYRDRVANETDPQVLAASIRALGRHGDPNDAIAIAAHLDDKSKEVRLEAAKALQRLHNPEVVEALAGRLSNDEENDYVRTACAVALGQYPEDQTFQALAAALDVRELSINEASAHSLTLLTGEDFGIDRVAWLTWYNAQKSPFAGQKPYLYPTFSRKLTFTDYLTFWDIPKFEPPGPPAGLRDDGAKSTYGTADAASSSTGSTSTPEAPAAPSSTSPSSSTSGPTSNSTSSPTPNSTSSSSAPAKSAK